MDDQRTDTLDESGAPPANDSAGDGQREVIAFLSRPDTYGSRVTCVERIDTHSAIVFLVGDRAYKLKRDVRFDYLDFSTRALRQAACAAEVRLNRRTAPGLYLGVVAVTREPDGSLAIGGPGASVDWLVEMVRFDQGALFDHLAAQNALDVRTMPELAEAIAALHATAERRFDQGGREGVDWVIEGNAAGFQDHGAAVFDLEACDRLTARSRTALERHSQVLDERRRAGFVRWCHGDLHLRNIVLIDGRPTLFDGVEFNEQIACIDVLYDLAFLLMDLWRRELHSHANVVFNEYLARTTDMTGLALLPLWLSCRAAVRAKTSATAAEVQPDEARARQLTELARQYLTIAEVLLGPPPARLIAVGGLSGSGKSTLAARLAPGIGAAPGALVVRSDMIRKSLFGVPPLVRLGSEGYEAEVTQTVYQRMTERAAVAVGVGHSVIVDAVFADPGQRAAVARVAHEAGVAFTGLWLDATPNLLARRIRRRVADVSDATVDVLRLQIARDPGSIDWHRIDAAADESSVQRRAEQIVSTDE